MKKLLIVGLLFTCNVNVDALESNATKSALRFGQLCGDDNCGCPDQKRPEQIV